MQKRLLLVAFHFPPLQGSTGVHRSLAFARYLGRYGWDVTVLTVTPGAYPRQSGDNNELIPEGIRVVRARGFDAQRHLSVFGRYPRALATPDRWSSWIYSGVQAGRRLLREWSPTCDLLDVSDRLGARDRVAAEPRQRPALGGGFPRPDGAGRVSRR